MNEPNVNLHQLAKETNASDSYSLTIFYQFLVGFSRVFFHEMFLSNIQNYLVGSMVLSDEHYLQCLHFMLNIDTLIPVK